MQEDNNGNFEGEGTNTPGITSLIGDRPEIYTQNRNFPTGRLNDFRKHRVRAWGIYNQPLWVLGDVDVAMICRCDSPLTYSLLASNVALSALQRQLGAGYVSLPATQALFFAGRGSALFDSAHPRRPRPELQHPGVQVAASVP